MAQPVKQAWPNGVEPPARPDGTGRFGSTRGLFVPKPVIHLYGQQHGPSDLDRIVRHRPSMSVADDGDSYSLGYSAPAAAWAAELANHLIHRDLRALPAPAHISSELHKCCSAVRNDCRRCATLYGQNPASVGRWPSCAHRWLTVKQQLTFGCRQGLLLPKPTSDATCHGLCSLTWDAASVSVRC